MFKDLFIHQLCRFAVGVCARGFGKSFFAAVCAITACRELMTLNKNVPNKVVYIIAPTFDQVKEIYFPLIAWQMGMAQYAVNYSQDRGYFEFPGNVFLRLVSYEAVERLRGKGAYFVVMDEVSSWHKGLGFKSAWESIIQPCIITRWSPQNARRFNAPSPGRALVISTPKGYNFLYDLFHYQENDELWKSYHYDYTKSVYLDQTEIERIKSTIDAVEWASEYLAQFKDSGQSVFYNFDRTLHVRGDIPYFQKGEDVNVCIDFNVGIMAASSFARRANQMHFLDDFKGAPNTPELANMLKQKYPDARINAYPDPTGNSAKSSAPFGETDMSILRSAGINVYARDSSPKIVDSVQAVNRRLKTANNDISMFFHPRCANTIGSMEKTTWVDRNNDLMTIDKKGGHEHWSDGVRYATEFLYPATDSRIVISQSKGF